MLYPLLIAGLSLLSSCGLSSEDRIPAKRNHQLPAKPSADIEKVRLKAKEAQRFCQKKKYSTDFCILIDMSLHSGIKRFFIWNFLTDTIQFAALVGHGCCNKLWASDLSKSNPTFSNTEDSHCSSLGKYKIGERGYSDWGVHIKYLLHGLEESNSNALSRYIVLHSWEKVSDADVFPDGTPEGWGCPTVSNNTMQVIDPMLRASTNPVLLWIYL